MKNAICSHTRVDVITQPQIGARAVYSLTVVGLRLRYTTVTEERPHSQSAETGGTGRAGSPGQGDGEFLKSFQDALPITLISTPRHALKTCREAERVEDVIRDAREADYDYVPVTSEEHRDEFIGELRTKLDRTGLVRDALDALSEPLLIGGDASILHFVRQADTKPRIAWLFPAHGSMDL